MPRSLKPHLFWKGKVGFIFFRSQNSIIRKDKLENTYGLETNETLRKGSKPQTRTLLNFEVPKAFSVPFRKLLRRKGECPVHARTVSTSIHLGPQQRRD
jgi:hypothetical protein